MLETIYNQTVTILNKLRRTDGTTGVDTWYKTVLNDVAWYTDSARSAGGSSVYIGSYIKVLVPFHDEYMQYLDWKELDDETRSKYFTMSIGDYIILGEIEDEEITANNIVSVMQKYGENVCTVKHHNANYNRYGAKVQLKIEGV